MASNPHLNPLKKIHDIIKITSIDTSILIIEDWIKILTKSLKNTASPDISVLRFELILLLM